MGDCVFCNTFLAASGGDRDGLAIMEATCAVCGKKSCNHHVSRCLAIETNRPCDLSFGSVLCEDCADDHRLSHLPLPPSIGYDHNDGWLSPTGDFYRCGYGGHETLAALLCGRSGQQLYSAGWVSFKTGMIITEEYYRPDDKVTQQQFDFITSWISVNNGSLDNPERFEVR